MSCKFCNKDEGPVMRSSFINGEVRHSQICLDCLWPLLIIKINTEKKESIYENGNVLSKKPFERKEESGDFSSGQLRAGIEPGREREFI